MQSWMLRSQEHSMAFRIGPCHRGKTSRCIIGSNIATTQDTRSRDGQILREKG